MLAGRPCYWPDRSDRLWSSVRERSSVGQEQSCWAVAQSCSLDAAVPFCSGPAATSAAKFHSEIAGGVPEQDAISALALMMGRGAGAGFSGLFSALLLTGKGAHMRHEHIKHC